LTALTESWDFPTRQNTPVIFTVDIEEGGEESITLKFEIADTGIDIKREDIGKLFGDFLPCKLRKHAG
jgi:DNA topoisomerase VI subunit B